MFFTQSRFTFKSEIISVSEYNLSGIMEKTQNLALTAYPPSLVLISLHVSAGGSETDPRGTEIQRIVSCSLISLIIP